MVILERNIRLLNHLMVVESVDTTTPQTDVKTNESDVVIIVITALAFAIFVVGLASVCYRWSSRHFSTLEQSVTSSSGSERELRTVRTRRGIDAAIVKSFPTFLYSEVKERRIGTGGGECAVCLCEFEDDDRLSLMPNCCHVYHADCVSVWLSDHSTCPICRVDLVYQPGEGSEPDPDRRAIDSTEAHLSDSMMWTNRSRPSTSRSMRLSRCRVSEILFSRSHTTGHCEVHPVENVDRFTLRLPEELLRQLTKETVVPTQVRSSRGFNRSRSVGSERDVFSEQRNNYKYNRRQHSMTFSFADCVWSGGDAVAPPNSPSRSIDYREQSFKELQPDDRV